MNKIAVFPGTFDPVTRGHEAIVRKALLLFDQVVVAIGENSTKSAAFPLEKRLQWLKQVFSDSPAVQVETYAGLTVDYCLARGASFIIRGLRSALDFEYEKHIGLTNRILQPSVETVFFLAAPEHIAINATLVREIIRNGGDASLFIPEGLTLE
ncbi:MAG TPA: pantetheine-phosphate adenylyltransferase [Bacteroidales bacterium]|nr:pantetheine-phosphate adenylyltransferase [Bacteroidales bacterium]HSA43484.1 pantetheine-phosphate adenylyltransferase [Bacteroidales bacterium]